MPIHNTAATHWSSVVNPHHVEADPDSNYYPDADPDSDFYADADPDPTFHPDEDPYPYPDASFHTKDQTLEKMLK